jgi:hypothetical protein
MRESSTPAPSTCRKTPNAFSIVGAPTSSSIILVTQARTAVVLTSASATFPHRGSTLLCQALLRVAAVFAETWPWEADHEA